MRSALAMSVVVVFVAACGSEFEKGSGLGAAGAGGGGAAGGAGGNGGAGVGGSGGSGGSGGASDGGSANASSGGDGGGEAGGAGTGGSGGSGGGTSTGGSAGGGAEDASTGGNPSDGGEDSAPACLDCNGFLKPTCCSCIPNECPVNYEACRCNPDCAAYMGCRAQCGGSTTCIANCKAVYPGGIALGDQLQYCSDQAGCSCPGS